MYTFLNISNLVKFSADIQTKEPSIHLSSKLLETSGKTVQTFTWFAHTDTLQSLKLKGPK